MNESKWGLDSRNPNLKVDDGTARQQLGFPESKHQADLAGELAVQLVCKDVFYSAILKQVLLKKNETGSLLSRTAETSP